MNFLEVFRDWDDIAAVDAGSLVFSEAGPADTMYVVLSGEVQLSRNGTTLDTEGPGGVIGEMAMIESVTHNDTATALTDLKLARIDRKQFRRLIADNTEFSLHVMAVLANRLRAVDNYVTAELGKKS